LHVLPASAEPGPEVNIGGHEFSTLEIAPTLRNEPFAIGFDGAVARLSALRRMFVEPDGSFVWVNSDPGQPSWQLDGNLYDQCDRLVFVELKGQCPLAAFDQFREAVALPPNGYMVQLLRHAVFLAGPEFQRFAATV
jgi:hypothetical protein